MAAWDSLLTRQPSRWKKDSQKELCRNSTRWLCLQTKDIRDVLRTAKRDEQRYIVQVMHKVGPME